MGTPMRPVSSPTCADGCFEAPLIGLMKVKGYDLTKFDSTVVKAMNEVISKAVLIWVAHTGDTVPDGKIELTPSVAEYTLQKFDKKPVPPATIRSHHLIKYGLTLKYDHGPFYRTRGGHRIPFEVLWLRIPY